jgi:hypothetical protein
MRHLWFTMVFLISISARAFSSVVQVTEADTRGWVWYAYNGAKCGLYDYTNPPLPELPLGVPAGCPRPWGAFYGDCGYSGSGTGQVPGSCWLGTDSIEGRSLDGIPCKFITKLTYSTYLAWRGCEFPNTPPYPQGHPAMQPWQLQIAIRKGGPSDPNFRWLMFRPNGLLGNDFQTSRYERWITWDCLSPNAIWYEAFTGKQGNWDFWFNPVTGYYKNAVLANPCDPTPNASWDMSTSCGAAGGFWTGTGKALNFEIGARKQTANIFGRSSWAWWRESFRALSFLDNFTIEAIDTSDPSNPVTLIPETTYDFELDPTRPHGQYGLTNAACYQPPVSIGRYQHWYVVWGRVLLDEAYQIGVSFRIDDGSGMPIKVMTDQYVPEGAYVRVKGQLEFPPVNPGNEPKNYRVMVADPNEPIFWISEL